MSDNQSTTPSRWPKDAARAVLRDAESLIAAQARSLWSEFKELALKQHVLGVAVGVSVATSFTKLFNALVSDFLLPPISLLPFMSRSLDEKFLVLKGGAEYNSLNGYNTRQQALADGALIWAYGNVLDELISFIGMGAVFYILGIIYGACTRGILLKPKTEVPECPYCGSALIRETVKRCASCTSWLDGREDTHTSVLVRRTPYNSF